MNKRIYKKMLRNNGYVVKNRIKIGNKLYIVDTE